MLSVAPAVNEVSTAFDTYWNSEWVYPITAFNYEKTVAELKENYVSARNELSEKVTQAHNSPYIQAAKSSKLMDKGELQENYYYWGQGKLIYDALSKAAGGEVATHIEPELGKLFRRAKKK